MSWAPLENLGGWPPSAVRLLETPDCPGTGTPLVASTTEGRLELVSASELFAFE